MLYTVLIISVDFAVKVNRKLTTFSWFYLNYYVNFEYISLGSLNWNYFNLEYIQSTKHLI